MKIADRYLLGEYSTHRIYLFRQADLTETPSDDGTILLTELTLNEISRSSDDRISALA